MTTVKRKFSNLKGMADHMPFIVDCAGKIVETGRTAFVTISDEEPRDDNDNRKFHAIIGDIAKAELFEGRPLEVVKASLVLAFVRELESMGEKIPKYMKIERAVCQLTQELISIRPSTTKFSKKWAREFCQYLWATGSELGVAWSDPASKEYELMMEQGHGQT